MNITTNINGKDISITLTKDQLKEIAAQTNKITVDNLTYESAKKIVEDNDIDVNPNNNYAGDLLKLVTIIAAANFLDNDNEKWIPNWLDNNYKYFPYFNKTKKGWSLDSFCWCCSLAYVGAGLYFKNESTGRTVVNNNMNLYNSYLG